MKPKKKPEPEVVAAEEKTAISPIKGEMTGMMGTFDSAALGTEEPQRRSVYGDRKKGATVSSNKDWEQSLKSRVARDAVRENRERLTMINQNNKTKRDRMEDIPDSVEVFMYSGQKLNIYEF